MFRSKRWESTPLKKKKYHETSMLFSFAMVVVIEINPGSEVDDEALHTRVLC